MKALYFICLCFVVVSCKQQQSFDINPTHHFDAEQLNLLTIELGRWIEPLPPNTTMSQRWDSAALNYYTFKSSLNKIYALYPTDTGCYFAYGQIVPSIHPGDVRVHFGKVAIDDSLMIEEYEEIYLSNIVDTTNIQTWVNIAVQDLLNNQNTITIDSINKKMEWPNAYFYFNKNTNQWDRR
jgi:hypothetical protein